MLLEEFEAIPPFSIEECIILKLHTTEDYCFCGTEKDSEDKERKVVI